MTQTYFPFDSGQGANITEAQWQKMAQNWLATGVLKGLLNELSVYADSTGMRVKVKSGNAWIKGHFYESDVEEILAIAAANATNPRIDRVILRLDWTTNNIQLAILQGVAATSPSAPALTQNTSRWEISLTQVRVNANAATIASGDVTDERNFVKNANSIQENFLNAVLQNAWVTETNGNNPARYYKDDMSRAHMTGFIYNSAPTIGMVIFTLPVGYRPLSNKYFNCFTYDGTNSAIQPIQVAPNGNVALYAKSSLPYLSLDNISFRAEQ